MPTSRKRTLPKGSRRLAGSRLSRNAKARQMVSQGKIVQPGSNLNVLEAIAEINSIADSFLRSWAQLCRLRDMLLRKIH
jgi:hypothetical protein